ncbi:ATP-dependent helicase HrpB [Marinobacteraceae bacterium S3BR75-40.1]
MTLPIESVLPELLDALEQHNTAILEAPPGAGKTTRVPLALLDAAWLAGRRILMLEPRRLAARSAARFMARQLGEKPGQTVGYRTRMDTRISAATRIEVVTEGILTRMVQDDPTLDAYGAILFDEFHERSLQADLGLALVHECQQALREDLRLLVMSATLESGPLVSALGQPRVIRSEGRAYPVTVHYRAPGRQPLAQTVAAVVREVMASEPGSVLVFLPGQREIRAVQRQLEGQLPDDAVLAPLFGDLSPQAQDRAIAPAAEGQRKVVLATDIAETSLTIEGIRVVVDSGLARRPHFDPNSAMTRLVTQRVSAASAEQRRGRAGRLAPGACYRLWPETEQERLEPYTPPEIRAADLSGLVLELAQWGVSDPQQLVWLDPPPGPAWAQAVSLLQQLEALDDQARITAHGRTLLGVGLEPRLAHLVVRGREWGHARLAAELAVLLSEKDSLGQRDDADMHRRILRLRGASRADAAARATLLPLIERLARKPDPEDPAATTVGLLLALAYPDRVAQRRPGKAARYRLANGRGAWLQETDALADEPYLVAADLDGVAREARIYRAAAFDPQDLQRHFETLLTTREQVGWDRQTGKLECRRVMAFGALELASEPLARPEPEAILAGLLNLIREEGLDRLPWDDTARQWQARAQLLHRLWPDDWPAMDDDALLHRLETWAGPFLLGITDLKALAGFPLAQALAVQFDYPQQQAFERLAPSHWTSPAGNRVAIDYRGDRAPSVSVKLQALFGLTETPSVAQGRVPLTLHLLSPAQRPVAVTQDLVSFWQQGYPQVRKDLRGRYPKHPWPEDPLSAQPQLGTRHRR